MGRRHRAGAEGARDQGRFVGLPLQESEEIVFAVTPSRAANFYRYLYTFGLYEFWRRRDTAVVTNRRVLMGRGLFNRDEYSVSITQIENARFARKGFNSYAQLTVVDRAGRRSERVGPMSSRSARRFVAEILKRQ